MQKIVIKKNIKECLDLFFVFSKIGLFTFGGGLAMMPMMQRELITKKKWITEEELLDYYAIGQSTPGIVAVNVSTFVGYKQLGSFGGVIATLGMITPSLIVIMVLATFINSISDIPLAQKALKGINVAVAALLTTVIINFAKKTIKNWWNFLLMIAAFILVFFFKIPSFILILFAILLGVVNTFIALKKNKKDGK
ncbi:MAG: chromate transporter [Treponema sp.]|jgi:chromate transporter|nr:chromate transporter [Treponema sp.]